MSAFCTLAPCNLRNLNQHHQISFSRFDLPDERIISPVPISDVISVPRDLFLLIDFLSGRCGGVESLSTRELDELAASVPQNGLETLSRAGIMVTWVGLIRLQPPFHMKNGYH
jgi:hypothetical protein